MSCARAAGTAAGCARVSGPTTADFVGDGKGDFLAETTYKYVGQGRGNLVAVTPTRILMGRVAFGIASALAIVLLVAAMWPSAAGEMELGMQSFAVGGQGLGECDFWGDPHVKSFDGGHPSFYGNGEQWIVRTPEIKIQGRYMGTQYTKGLAATNKIIVGGAFIGHHTVAVGTLESDELAVDGQAVLASFPSHYSLPGGFGEISYDSNGQLIDDATETWTKHVVTMRLPQDVIVVVFRWSNYIDLRIQMPRIPDLDGSCGNFNGDPADDSTEAIFSRIGAMVPRGENMFNRRADVAVTPEEEEILETCARAKRSAAKSSCIAELGPGASQVQAKFCEFDHCFGSNEHVLKMAMDLGI